MIKFYFLYDRDRHKAKFVVIEEGGSQDTYYVDEIFCNVYVRTERTESTPKFVVRGEAHVVTLTIGQDNYTTIHLR